VLFDADMEARRLGRGALAVGANLNAQPEPDEPENPTAGRVARDHGGDGKGEPRLVSFGRGRAFAPGSQGRGLFSGATPLRSFA
jgi:hypothetical protein